MIIKYDLKKFIKDKGLSQTHLAKKVGVSKQLFGYYIKKGDLSLSMIEILSKELNMSVGKITSEISKNYVKTKI